MAKKKFLHVTVSGEFDAKKLEEAVFDKALDWVRYAPNCWILWTSRDPDDWFIMLRHNIQRMQSFFVVEINLENRRGWLPKWIWEWINKKRI
jgi:hypothetical protein